MTNLSTIQVIKKGEGLNIEFKSKIDSVFKIAKTLTSFANTSGGTLLIGVDDKGGIVGVESEIKELQKLEKAVSQCMEHPLSLKFKTERFEDKLVLRVEIDESSDKPHFAINEKQDRIIYIRVKDKSIPIPRMLIQGEAETSVAKILNSRQVKTLVNHLKEVDTIDVKEYSRMINISEKRANRMLNDLSEKQILIKLNKSKIARYSLKWTE